MSTRIAIIGGGSHQWAPTLITDIAATPSLHGSELVLIDLDERRLPRMARYVEHVSAVRDVPLSVRTTTDRRVGLAGADFVVVCISTGGLGSMAHDLAVPERYGIRQPVGDTVGPGGISRALRNIPVLIDIARDMEDLCPDAWLLNVTNPMTALCRAVTRETDIATIGLCHEVSITSFWMSLLLDTGTAEIHPVVTGVNHLPIVTELDVAGQDGLAQLQALAEDEAELAKPLPGWLNDVLGDVPRIGFRPPPDGRWTKAALLHQHRAKFELFRRFGGLPFAGDRHTVEFFPGFVTETSGWGEDWGIALTTIDERQAEEDTYVADLEAKLASEEVPAHVSMEMVVPVIDSLLAGTHRELPLNLPNAGQCPDLPADAVVESMCVVDADGVRGRDVASAPPYLAEATRRVAASQELTVQAAITGDRDAVVAAMLADPLAGRSDHTAVVAMTDDLLAATAEWLPQFST